jgi:hypothetical protein
MRFFPIGRATRSSSTQISPMPALDPKRLIELLRIAKHSSYTRAAAAHGVSQPACRTASPRSRLRTIRRATPILSQLRFNNPLRPSTLVRIQPCQFSFSFKYLLGVAVCCAERYRRDCAGLGTEIRHRPMKMAGNHVGVPHGHLDRAMAEASLGGLGGRQWPV